MNLHQFPSMNFISDLEEAEDQYQMALRTHLQNIDTLIKLHDSRLYSLERNFQQELANIQVDFMSEKEVMLSKFYKEKRELQAIIDAIESEEDVRNNDVSTSSPPCWVLFFLIHFTDNHNQMLFYNRPNMHLNNCVKKFAIVTWKKSICYVFR